MICLKKTFQCALQLSKSSMILMSYGQRVVSWWTPPPASQHWHVLLWEDKVCGCDRLRLAEKKCICRMWIFLPMTYHCSLHGLILRPEASTLFGSIWMDHFLQFGCFRLGFPVFLLFVSRVCPCFCPWEVATSLSSSFPRNFDLPPGLVHLNTGQFASEPLAWLDHDLTL